MDDVLIAGLAGMLHDARRNRAPIAPLTAQNPDLTVDAAYAVQRCGIELRCAEGDRITGMKIGLTSRAIQQQLGVGEPDYGCLLSSMHVYDGDTVDAVSLIAPRVEGEIAFVLDRALPEGRVTEADVLRSTAFVLPAIEIIDSRIADWKLTLSDTVADNASSGLFVLGGVPKSPIGLDLRSLGLSMTINGDLAATGAGAASLGNPVRAVAWLATTLQRYGRKLGEGDIVLSGGLCAAMPVSNGSWVRVDMQSLGSVHVTFEAERSA